MRAVLELTKEISGQVIIVLGDMLELGESSPHYHQEVGKLAANASPKVLITYGAYATAELADAYDMQVPLQKAIRAKTQKEVQEAVSQLAKAGDTVIYKASNGMYLGEAIPKN